MSYLPPPPYPYILYSSSSSKGFFFACIYDCTQCVHLVPERVLDPLELELQMVMSCHVDTGNQIRAL